MANYSDITCAPGAWTPIPSVAEDTLISPVTGNALISSHSAGGSSGIPFPNESVHLVKANTAVWMKPRGQTEILVARMTA